MRMFDAHVHLLDKPFSALFDNSHIKDGAEGELHLYEEYRRVFGIEGAFVVCCELGHWPQNNKYVESLKKERDWIYSFGYLKSDPVTMREAAVDLRERGHFGLSCYLDHSDCVDWLASTEMAGFWRYVEEKRTPICFNMSAFQCRPLVSVLDRHPGLTIIISHMARPKVTGDKLDEDDYAPLLAMARFAGVYVKLSGFYAFVEDGWRYPQTELFTVVDCLKDVFGARRLLFGSDFPPVLEFNTFRQAIELIRNEYRSFTESEMEDVYWGNAHDIITATERTQ